MKKSLHLLLILLFVNSIIAQDPNDCVNAVNICGNGVFTTNSVSGIGTIQEVASCGSSEHNSIWLKITIAESGTLSFDLKPFDTDINVDYDFWVYGPNKSCGAGLGVPIRCCTTNPLAAGLADNWTGMDFSTTSTSSGPGAAGTGYVRFLDATAGEFYYIAIDRGAGDNGFEIEWTGTAKFVSGPVANAIEDYVVCDDNDDGFATFDLDSRRTLINPDLVANTVNFYETFLEVSLDMNSISSSDYVNVSPNQQTIYARVTDKATGCYSITSFELVVDPCLGIDSPLLNTFRATAYPNPFKNGFVIDVNTLSQEPLNIKVYDMLGKLVEQREVSPYDKMPAQKIGQDYPSGIYNIIVTQEDEVKIIRVIKK